MLREDTYASVAANISVLIRFMSRLDDKPVKVEDQLDLLETQEVIQKPSLIGPVEEIYIERDSEALIAAFSFRDRF